MNLPDKIELNKILSELALNVSNDTKYWIERNGILGEWDSSDFVGKPIEAILALKEKWEIEAVERYKRQDYQKAVFNKGTYDLINKLDVAVTNRIDQLNKKESICNE